MTFKYFNCNLSVRIIFRTLYSIDSLAHNSLLLRPRDLEHFFGKQQSTKHIKTCDHTQNRLIRKHTDPSTWRSIKTIQRVNIQLHHTRVTYQRSSVTQAWWWGLPPVRRGRKFNLLCKNKIEWACLCITMKHTLSFLLALNFFRHSTVSCLCIMEATVERCYGNK